MSPQASPPLTALLTEAEFRARYENVRAELVEGVVKELPMPGFPHGKICMLIGHYITGHVLAQDLGQVTCNDTWVQTGTDPDTLRGGDVCFWSYARLPKGVKPGGVVPAPPDLVVEVRSPSDRWTDLFAKAREYLHAGVTVVVLLDPDTATASVHRSDDSQQLTGGDAPLELPDILPGFSCAVSRFFA